MHQKVINNVGIELLGNTDTESKLVFYKIYIPQVWDTLLSDEDQNIFRFVR